jgi:CubicO group peptidase (beta-lactamase class C family)
MILAHRAALPAIRRPLRALAMYDWDLMTAALAAEEPWWPPGAAHGYHVNTFGFLVGEVARRASGERLKDFFRREIAAPLGADVQFGVDPADEARVADFLLPDGDARLAEHLVAEETRAGGGTDAEARRALLHAVYANPSGISGFGTVNTPAWRAAEIPSTNGHASARGLARVYTALACGGTVDGVRVLGRESLDAAIAEASAGPDRVLGRASRFGLGFQLTQPERALGTNARSFGHFGAGGSLGFADPAARLAFGYVMNNPGPRWQNPRNRALIDAVYAVVG